MEPHPAADSLSGRARPRGRRWRRWAPLLPRPYLDAFLVAVLAGLFVRTFLAMAYVIPSGSMEDSLLVGDHVLVNRFLYAAPGGPLAAAVLPMRAVERGDVVVFRHPSDPERDYVKRCVATAGDEISVRGSEVVLGALPAAAPALLAGTGDMGPYRVPAGHLFCLGDNRDNSEDSRSFGPVPLALVRGRAVLVYWSVAPRGPSAPRWAGALPLLRPLLATRWERFLHRVR